MLAWTGLACLLPCGALAAAPANTAVPAAFKIYVSEPGVYKVAYAALAAELRGTQPRSAALGLANAGKPVPIWVEDGGDDRFGPGDWIEFVGARLQGEVSYYNENSNLNVYWLTFANEQPARQLRAPAAALPAGGAQANPWRTSQHHERDLLLLRFPTPDDRPEELWYWTKLTQLDAKPFELPLDVSDLDHASTAPVTLRVHLRGWSRPASKPADTPDHRVELLLNGSVVASGEWNGTSAEGARIERTDLPASLFKSDANTLSVRIPSRLAGKDPLVDVVVLNWVELDYARSPLLGPEQAHLQLTSDSQTPLELRTPRGQTLVVYSEAGERIDGRATTLQPIGGEWQHRFMAPKAGGYFAVTGGRLREPVTIEPDQTSDWKGTTHQADYIIITHPRLAAAVKPLADFHRQRGLHVALVDIADVYDEFNAGVLHPRAIRDFISHAYHDWQPPRPRFVLLVGDASWDTKNTRLSETDYPDAAYSPGHGVQFAHITSTPYSEAADLNHRNLIPTWNYGTYDGHAAGDNGFVAVDGDDLKPDLAIGRFPVTEPAEVEAIVRKTIRYMAKPEPGPWRRDVLWITNEEAGMQSWSDTLARELGGRGFSSEKVYPPVAEKSDGREQEYLREALAHGHLIVHFAGHGGRFVWRTGPPDWAKHRDLFNLEDIDKLPASERLPIVLSMTCYSAPFDHPSADSIGEKFLRVPEKGAVAVFAASWRNAPSLGMSRPLFEELLTKGTLGEAIEHAKQKSHDRTFIQQYNLLGDPALELALPQQKLEVVPAGGQLAVSWPSPGFTGKATVEWLDEKFVVAERAVLAVKGRTLQVPIPARSELRSVRVYTVDPLRGDAMGFAELPVVAKVAAPAATPAATPPSEPTKQH